MSSLGVALLRWRNIWDGIAVLGNWRRKSGGETGKGTFFAAVEICF